MLVQSSAQCPAPAASQVPMDVAWRLATKTIEQRAGAQIYAHFLRQLSFESFSGGIVALSTSTKFLAHHVLTNYIGIITDCLREQREDVVSVGVIVRGGMNQPRRLRSSTSALPPSAALPFRSSPRFRSPTTSHRRLRRVRSLGRLQFSSRSSGAIMASHGPKSSLRAARSS